jgi:hypothetical protein
MRDRLADLVRPEIRRFSGEIVVDPAQPNARVDGG